MKKLPGTQGRIVGRADGQDGVDGAPGPSGPAGANGSCWSSKVRKVSTGYRLKKLTGVIIDIGQGPQGFTETDFSTWGPAGVDGLWDGDNCHWWGQLWV